MPQLGWLCPLCCPGPQTYKIRYNEHVSYTRSNNPHEAYAVPTLKNCHEYDPLDEIMVLAQHFTKWSRMNASENFHIQLHKCIVKSKSLALNHLRLHMTFRYAMHASIKIYIILYSQRWTACNSYTMPQMKQVHIYIYVCVCVCARLRESVPYVKVYRYNPKHLYPKLNGYGDNGQRILKI